MKVNLKSNSENQMNYLAHIYLAQPTADSYFGNLLGDFGGRIHAKTLSKSVNNGLENHYLVDKYTDSHCLVKQARGMFSPQRRRFSGIAVDVLFDHFLIRHWDKFSAMPFSQFKENSYYLLNQSMTKMPIKMQKVVSHLTTNDWFESYKSIEGIGLALDNIAKRIRFTNQFTNSLEDINKHYLELEQLFLVFFPQLISHITKRNLE